MLVPNISHMSHHIEEPIDYNFAHIRRLQLDVLELACPDHSNSLASRHWPCPEAGGGLCADSGLHRDLIGIKLCEPLLQSHTYTDTVHGKRSVHTTHHTQAMIVIALPLVPCSYGAPVSMVNRI